MPPGAPQRSPWGELRGVGGPLVLHAVHGVPERVLRTEECSMPLAPSTPEREREREVPIDPAPPVECETPTSTRHRVHYNRR